MENEINVAERRASSLLSRVKPREQAIVTEGLKELVEMSAESPVYAEPIQIQSVEESYEQQEEVKECLSEQTCIALFSSVEEMVKVFKGSSKRRAFGEDKSILKSVLMLSRMSEMPKLLVLLTNWEITSQGMCVVSDCENDNKLQDFKYYLEAGYVMGDSSVMRSRQDKIDFFYENVSIVDVRSLSEMDIKAYKYAYDVDKEIMLSLN